MKKILGFTLIELMIVVAIIGILASLVFSPKTSTSEGVEQSVQQRGMEAK